MHQRAAGAFGEGSEQGVPGIAVAPWAFYLDELVVEERAGGLLGDRVRKTLLSQPDDGLQRVGQPAQVAALFLGQVRGG